MIYYMGFPCTVVNLIRPRTYKYVAGIRRELKPIVTIELSNGDTREVLSSELAESWNGELDRIIAGMQQEVGK